MSKENLLLIEDVLDGEKSKEDREIILDGLKDQIKEFEKDADADFQKEIDRVKSKFGIGGAKKKPTPKAKPKAKAKTTKKPRAKTTPEQRAKNREKVQNATGKTIEECKEILAKYEALRGKTTQKDKQRVDKLKDEDKIIDGTNVKTADAITETTAKQVPKKIKQEVDAIEKEAEQEAKKEVNPKGKTKAEVNKEVEEVKIEKIEEKVKDMTKDLADKSNELIDAMTNTIKKLSPSKEEAIKFLMDIRNHVDVLLKANKFELGGAVQSYDVAWAGGGRPMPMFERGGEVDSDIVIAIFEPNEFKGKIETSYGNKTLKGFENMIANNDAYDVYLALKPNFEGKGDGMIATNYGDKNMKGLIAMIENAKRQYSKGGNFADGGEVGDYVEITLIPKKTSYRGGKGEVYKNMQKFFDTINSNEDKYPFIHYVSVLDSNKGNPKDISEMRVSMMGEKSGFDDVEKKGLYDLFDLKKSREKIKNYSKGGKFADGGMVNKRFLENQTSSYRDRILKSIANHYAITTSAIKEELYDKDAEMIYEYIGNDRGLRMKVYEDMQNYSKGGNLPRKKGLGWKRDRERLSKEPHEQAYKSKRKGDYSSFEMGGEVKEEYKEFFKRYEENEDRNAHLDNAMMLVSEFGTADELKRLIEIQQMHHKQGYLTLQQSLDLYEIQKPYYRKMFAKGGTTRKKGLGWKRDMERLSKEPHEQAYKSKRKGKYSSFEMGGKTMIDEEFSNVPEELEEVFGMYNEDEETYTEMKRLKGIANQKGYDFDYGLDGEPTEFWKINKMAKGGKTNFIQDVVDSPNFREGAFTRKAEARGMSTDAFMNQVLHSPHLYDERTRKQAQFMKNAFND